MTEKEAKRVGFISLGCPKNLVDSEVMMGQLRASGYEITGDAEQAETLVVNTCGFIEEAKKESIEAILDAVRLKSEGRCRRVVVAGCLVERYRDELAAELPEVDAFIGTDQVRDIVAACRGTASGRFLPVLPLGHKTATYLYDDATPRVLATPKHFAYIKIAEGCDRPCSFCAIPTMRGKFRSRRFGSVLSEAEKLIEQGVRELILVAQDSSRYGEDLGMRDGLAQLLRALARLDGVEWVRVMYAYPTHVSEQFLDVMAEEPKAVKYLDLPLQHASTRVLKAMRRGGTRRSLERLIERVRRRVPGIAIRTTFIVGFPGETEEDFNELLGFVRDMEFDRVGVFTYSDEEGTPAYLLPDKVDARTAERRRARLMREQERISRRKNRARVGSVVRVLFEGVSPETDLLWQGRMETQAPEIDGCVLINDAPAGCQPQIGDFVQVQITQAHAHDLIGTIVAGGQANRRA